MKINILKKLYLNAFNQVLNEWSQQVDESKISLRDSSLKIDFVVNKDEDISYTVPIIPTMEFFSDVEDPKLKDQLEQFHVKFEKFLHDFEEFIDE